MTVPPSHPRRRVTLVDAVRKSISRATSSPGSPTTTTASTSNGSPASRRPTSTYPTSRRSSLLQTRTQLYSRSASSVDLVSQQSSSAASMVGGVATPVGERNEAVRLPRPDALPTPGFYERYPRAVGPLANILIATPEEYKMFCMTARAIRIVAHKDDRNVRKDRLCREDVEKGGFYVYQPNSETPRYFLLYDRVADVYGTSTYTKR